ncbi:SH3 domain-containing protein [Terrihabitans sp. B22-R8]|uniref:SH3 domain-containing protein n=1 Tax=Terrihabitans sp. B22-R8 TaxID=3425128 RepID=UPI00403C4444
MRTSLRLSLLGIVAAVIAGGTLLLDDAPKGTASQAQAQQKDEDSSRIGPAGAIAVGAVSGLPIPRFVSLKSDKVNVRRGPANDHEVQWVFTRAGLPVEITAEWDNWRRIRDSDGGEGWVFHSLLSGRRTALVAPWSQEKSLSLYRQKNAEAAVVARLQPKVLANVEQCDGTWCRVSGDGFQGFMQQEQLWGAYPGEKFD